MATRVRGSSPTPFPMDRGIDRIVRVEAQAFEVLPAGDIAPAFSPVKPRLDQLFARPNLQDYLNDQLAPSMDEPAVLIPARFQAALASAIELLGQLQESDTRNARVFRRAGALMREQAHLRDLVRMYCSALIKP